MAAARPSPGRVLRDQDFGSRGWMARDPGGHAGHSVTHRPGAHRA